MVPKPESKFNPSFSIRNQIQNENYQGYLLELEEVVARKLVVLEVENILLDTQRKEAALEKKL